MRSVARPNNLPVSEIFIESKSGSKLAGWFLKADNSQGAILLLHGVRGNRGGMVDDMRHFHDLGYDVLAIDFQAHGESPGEHITFGYLEALDAAAAVEYLWRLDASGPVLVFGRSLGGAAAVLADYDRPPTAMIIEAVYSDIETAIGNRISMRLGNWSRILTPLVSWQFQLRLGISAAKLSPVIAMEKVHCPLLIIYGSNDLHARPEEAHLLKDAASGPVSIIEVMGADHASISRASFANYYRHINEFLRSL